VLLVLRGGPNAEDPRFARAPAYGEGRGLELVRLHAHFIVAGAQEWRFVEARHSRKCPAEAGQSRNNDASEGTRWQPYLISTAVVHTAGSGHPPSLFIAEAVVARIRGFGLRPVRATETDRRNTDGEQDSDKNKSTHCRLRL
jgi:hypothetical protein